MEIRAVGRCLVVLSIVGVLLASGCTSMPPSGAEQSPTDASPRSPFEIVAPIHYQGTVVNDSNTEMTALVFNLTVAPERRVSGVSAQDSEVNITTMYITYTDGRDLYFLDPGDYSFSQQETGDGDDTLEPGEVVELALPLRQQPIPANTNVYIEFWTPYHGALTLSFRTPDVIEASGQVTEFVAAPFVPH
jgi:hypothetical protein